MLCPLCAEPMSELAAMVIGCRSLRLRRRLERCCCHQSICQSCFYRHIRSVWDEGMTGNGRKQLVCPMGCGQTISDSDVRSCLHRQHAHLLWSWIGFSVFVFFNGMGCLKEAHQDPMRTSIYYLFWLYFTTTTAERRDLQRYEQWSLAVAIRSMPAQTTQHCPAPDCNYTWVIANPEYRQSKFQHERQTVLLWYAPPAPDSTITGRMMDWVHPSYAKILQGENPPANDALIQQEMARDGRLMICAKCHTTFCGLCRRPWNNLLGNNNSGRQQRRRYSHSGVSCTTYRHRNPLADDEYAFVSQVADARMCPGCSLRTSRTSGCNHMTCPCGTEWCYVCERVWNMTHYGCVDRAPEATTTIRTQPGQCVIL